MTTVTAEQTDATDRRDGEMSKDAPVTWLDVRSAYGIHQRTFVDRLLPLYHPHAYFSASS
jgi:hypothetical protein